MLSFFSIYPKKKPKNGEGKSISNKNCGEHWGYYDYKATISVAKNDED